jgi:hypothetical protein
MMIPEINKRFMPELPSPTDGRTSAMQRPRAGIPTW